MNAIDVALSGAGRWVFRGAAALTPPRLSILIFHRVVPQEDPLFPSEVDAQRFDRLMGLVARSYQVLPLADAVRHLANGSLPRRAMSITFDDGYADNHDVALPILKRHGLPACFFIATGFLNGGRMFNDTVIEAVRHSPKDQLDLSDFGLGALAMATPSQRSAVIGKLLPVIKYKSPEERPQALARLIKLCQPRSLPNDLMMTDAQVQAMHAAGMEIGAHTVRHPILATLDDADAQAEIGRSRDVLQGLLDHPVSLFAYPNGQPDRDYARRHASIVQRLGFLASVTTAPGVSCPGADLFQLPRFSPWDRDAWRWMSRLATNHWRDDFATATG